jgi:hypothetical protein
MKESVGKGGLEVSSAPEPAAPSRRAAPGATEVPPKRARPRGTRPPRPHVILFLAANPGGTTRLALDEECSAIERELQMTPGRDDFDFRSKWAVSVDEMMRCLNELQPMIIHFSGHACAAQAAPGGGVRVPDGASGRPGPGRDIEPSGGSTADTGIYLQDTCVTGPALAQMIASAAPAARVLVLNACLGDAVAESLRKEIDCVVSMNGVVGDDAARSFAVGFYRALGNRRSVGNAVAQAVATLAAKQLPDAHLPVCRTRDGVSADQLILRPRELHQP